MWKQAIDVAPNNKDIVGELYLARSIEGLRYLGTLSEKELRVYEIAMEPDEACLDGMDKEEIRLLEGIREKYFRRANWYRFHLENLMTDEGWGPASQRDGLIEKARFMIGAYPKRKVELGRTGRRFDNDTYSHVLQYTDPSRMIICSSRDFAGIDAALFVWTYFEM